VNNVNVVNIVLEQKKVVIAFNLYGIDDIHAFTTFTNGLAEWIAAGRWIGTGL
jgi:hypothetical protein